MNLAVEECEALHGVIHRLEQRWQDAALTDREWHVYDRLPFWDFIRGLRKAGALTEGRRLIDLGCGIGTNLAIAHHLGWEVSGVDKRSEYAAAASELLPEAAITCNDLMELGSIAADVIYMYRPARGDELQDGLEDHIRALLLRGTVCFWPYRHDPEVWVV